ncbi:MAG TPA: alkaline phosphatase family protein [Candidatus Binataceae bacterium]|nr:alkaline phosphatase family protein [Candidatus Binataceae bacterium]
MLFLVGSCTPATKLLFQGGEKQAAVPHPAAPGPHVLIFAFDGVGYNQLMTAIQSGKTPNLTGLLGRDQGGGLYEHAYSAPNAISILPSTTMAAWSSIFSGEPPAYTGVPGNEWFVRERMRFFAPAPVSIADTADTLKMVTNDLVGKSVMCPTLFEMAGVQSAVSLNAVYRGADVFTTVTPASFVAMMSDFVAGKMVQEHGLKKALYTRMDIDSVPKVIDSFNEHGVPRLQVVYFPGIDLYTHVAPDPLPMEVDYVEQITDPLVGQILHEYHKRGVIDQTYVMIVADHGHTPVLRDQRHALGSGSEDGPAQLMRKTGFRPRPFVLNPPPNQQDYQVAFAYQGAIAYVYLADRSTCPNPGDRCDWSKAPRFKEDVLPAARAFGWANRTGRDSPRLKDTLDLIFTREPRPPGRKAAPYRIFDGRGLVEIDEYLEDHPRPDLLQLDRRMRGLSAGPYGDRAGDILLLSKTGLERPIGDRYYFSGLYHSWHGSASEQDSHVPLVVACTKCSGKRLHDLVEKVAHGRPPSQLDVTPLALTLLNSEIVPDAPEAPSSRSATGQ